MPRVKDAYDLAVEELSRPGADIAQAWITPTGWRGGCLFAFVGTGCPTMVKANPNCYKAVRGLGATIRRAAIPDSQYAIRPRHLRAFARIQRLADKLLRRQPPDLGTLRGRLGAIERNRWIPFVEPQPPARPAD